MIKARRLIGTLRTPNGLSEIPQELRVRLAQVRQPQFRRDPECGGWLLLGLADQLPVGAVVAVHRATAGDETLVRVTGWEAEYQVIRRDQTPALYVLANFENEG